MKESLYIVAKEYVSIIEMLEKTKEPDEIHKFGEKRVEFHLKFIELLKEQGIEYKDRDHATRIAIRIAKGEL